MTDLVERARARAHHHFLNTVTHDLFIELAEETVRLQTENWQLKQACGYPIPADKETINNPFKCGICDARSLSLQES